MKNKILLEFFLSFIMFSNLIAQNEKFDDFINNFCQDSMFQFSRIKFPLLYISWDYDNDRENEILIYKEKYKFDKLYYNLMDISDGYTIFYDNFECKFRDTDERVFQWKGFTDMDRRYYFKRLDGKWYLVKILDYDPLE